MTPIQAWGRLSAEPHHLWPLQDAQAINCAPLQAARPALAHGMGRSYGDVALNPGGNLWLTRGLDHLISFDRQNGRLRCEAGVLLRDIQQLAIASGWILPVTPGTQLITVGGAIANDVHGKNHHAQGSFGDHIHALQLIRTDGQQLECSRTQHVEWLNATVGGLGLTGLISQAELQLQPCSGPWLESETLAYHSLDEFFQLADDSEAEWQHTVSWIDCLARSGRGLFMRANPCAHQQTPPRDRTPLRMPLTPPLSLVNSLSLKAFNTLYFHWHKQRHERRLVHYVPFFYPLDNLQDWNRMYGPRGFYQYQSVIPRQHGREAIAAMLQAIAASGAGSFLAVLKTFGQRQAPGLLSFARPGVTLALDFPNQGQSTLRLFERLDSIVREAGGTLYPAKDARMPRDLFEQGYPRLDEFLTFRDPGISSGLSRRLMGY